MLTAQERNTIKRRIQANHLKVFVVSLQQMDAAIDSARHHLRTFVSNRPHFH